MTTDPEPYRTLATVEADMTARAEQIEIRRIGSRTALLVDGTTLELGPGLGGG